MYPANWNTMGRISVVPCLLALAIIVDPPSSSKAGITTDPFADPGFTNPFNGAMTQVGTTELNTCYNQGTGQDLINRLTASPRDHFFGPTALSGNWTTPLNATTATNGTGSNTVTGFNPALGSTGNNAVDLFEDGVPRDPGAELTHEMSHANDMDSGLVINRIDPGSGLPIEELVAIGLENAYRQANGLPLRTRERGHNIPTISATPLDPQHFFPPVAAVCEPTLQNSEFNVTVANLAPSTAYDLMIMGTAPGGVSVNVNVGSITTDANGAVNNQTFVLPQLPAHRGWALVAMPHSFFNYCPSTILSTGVAACILEPTAENSNGTLTVNFDGGSGWQPGGTVTYTIHVLGDTSSSVVANPDGTIPAAAPITAGCVPNVTPTFSASGPIIDHPNGIVLTANSLFTCR